jgi:hypothetical protein
LKSWATRNQIVIFILLSSIISWLPWYIGGSGFFAWGPSLAGLITVLAVDGWQGFIAMLRRHLR